MTLVTTLGPLRRASERGLVLPHEHVFCDLRTYESPTTPGQMRAKSAPSWRPSCDKRGSWG
jgi:predicted metal-dependent phosphotriesterase family hydrolase